MPSPFLAGDSPHYGATGDYYYHPAAGTAAAAAPPPPPTATGGSPYMNGPGMPLPMMVNQLTPATTSTPPLTASTPHPHHHHHPQYHHHHLQQQQQQQQHYYPHPMLSQQQQQQQIPTTATTITTTATTPPPLPPLQPVSIMSPSIVAATLASNSTASTPPPPPPSSSSAMDQEYCDFLYHAGFLQGRLADTLVDIPSIHKTYPLHALILARSPTFHRMLLSDQASKPTVSSGGRKRYTIRLSSNNSSSNNGIPASVTEEAMTATLGHLYRPMSHQDVMYLFARPRTLLSILDVADYLDIQPLTSMIYEALGHEWNVETILFWLPYLAPTTTTAATATGSSTSSTKQQQSQPTTTKTTASTAFGIHYLTHTLPQQLDAFYHDDENYMELAHVYAHLPLGLLEPCIEAEALNVRDPMQRLAFAKQVMAMRQQWMEMDDGLSVALRFHQGEVAVKVIHPTKTTTITSTTTTSS